MPPAVCIRARRPRSAPCELTRSNCRRGPCTGWATRAIVFPSGDAAHAGVQQREGFRGAGPQTFTRYQVDDVQHAILDHGHLAAIGRPPWRSSRGDAVGAPDHRRSARKPVGHRRTRFACCRGTSRHRSGTELSQSGTIGIHDKQLASAGIGAAASKIICLPSRDQRGRFPDRSGPRSRPSGVPRCRPPS